MAVIEFAARTPSEKPLLSPSSGLALQKLVDRLRQTFRHVRESVQSADSSESACASLNARLAQAEGALRFAHADSPAALVALMRLAVTQNRGNRHSDEFIAAMSDACDQLMAMLDLWSRRPDPVTPVMPAAVWLPAWHALSVLMPGQSLTPAALISLDVDAMSSNALLLIEGAACTAGAAGTAATRRSELRPNASLDSVLLRILRSEAGSDDLHDALMQISAVINEFRLSAPQARQRLHWAVMRLFCEQLATDPTMDLAPAKKILSVIVRMIRQGSAASANIDTWVREALYQLGGCEQPSSDCLVVRTCFRLDWQFGDASLYPGMQAPAVCMSALREQIEALMADWKAIDQPVRQQRLDELLIHLEREPRYALLASVFAAATRGLADKEDFQGASGLVVLQEYADAVNAGRLTADDAKLAVHAMESASALWADKHSMRLHVAARQLMRPASQAALKSTLLTSLREAEQTLDALLDQGEPALATETMRQALASTTAALAIASQAEVLTISCALSRLLAEASLQRAGTESDLAVSWVQLCAAIEAWQVRGEETEQASAPEREPETESESASEPALDLELVAETVPHAHASVDCSANSCIRKIFEQEAIERVDRLKFMLSMWADNAEQCLPVEATRDAHALAGSSATIGLMAIHRWALALEQAIEHQRQLPPAQQHLAADALLQGLRSLEQMLSTDDMDASAASQCVPDFLHRLASQSEEESGCQASQTGWSDDAQSAQTQILQVPHEPTWTPQSDWAAHQQNVEAAAAGQLICAESSGSDAELFALFSEEASELLPMLQQLLTQWRQAPHEGALLPEMMRLLHTLKGSARMAGEMSLGECLHMIEHEFAQQASQFNPEKICHLIDQLEIDIVQLFGAICPMEMVRPAQAEPSPIVDTLPQGSLSLPSAADSRVLAAPKVRSDLLERASSMAAELLVGVVRITEDLQHQRHWVAELADNLDRLRLQLRELELQSESRIAAQLQSQNVAAASAFDPLEFDRYTRLQELTRMTTESLADLTSVQRGLARHTDMTATRLSQQARQARLLQSDLQRAGMQAFSSVEQRFRHLVRQTATEAGREVRFELDGGQIEIDRLQLDRLSGPLQHLLRNAVVHGIEAPELRENLGKPREGLVCLALRRQGGELRLQVSDDGRGLDLVRIRERAIAKGLLLEDEVSDDASLIELIFSPGLTTTDEVTELAGRGIGMDAVRTAVVRMGGALKVDSLAGTGTCITLALPQLRSTQQVVIVSAGKEQIALPSSLVQQLIQQDSSTLQQAMDAGSFEWQRQHMPLRYLSSLLGASDLFLPATQRMSVIVLRQLDQWLAIIVDDVHGHREVVVKQASAQLAKVPGLAGATFMPDGSVLLIMNPLSLHAHCAHLNIVSAPSNVVAAADKAPLVMVVDDSLTMRRVSQRLLERQGYGVTLARHGIEALEQLRELRPVALLLDIEMPHMDGFELLTRLRADQRFESIPVAMITSRTAERHRQRAMALGANAYFGKPYREQELMAWLGQWVPVMNDGSSKSVDARVAA